MFVSQEKFQTNRQKLDSHVSLVSADRSNSDISSATKSDLGNMLTARIVNPLHKYGGIAQGLGDKDVFNCQDVTYSTSARLPLVEKIPSYTTWIFLDRFVTEIQNIIFCCRFFRKITCLVFHVFGQKHNNTQSVLNDMIPRSKCLSFSQIALSNYISPKFLSSDPCG